MSPTWDRSLALATGFPFSPTNDRSSAPRSFFQVFVHRFYRISFIKSGVMMACMVRALHDFKIFNSIIRRVMIDVMNDFRFFKFSTDVFFYYKTMFRYILFTVPNSFIPRVGLYRFSFPSSLAFAPARETTKFLYFKTIRPTKNNFSTAQTFLFNFWHSAIIHVHVDVDSKKPSPAKWQGESH